MAKWLSETMQLRILPTIPIHSCQSTIGLISDLPEIAFDSVLYMSSHFSDAYISDGSNAPPKIQMDILEGTLILEDIRDAHSLHRSVKDPRLAQLAAGADIIVILSISSIGGFSYNDVADSLTSL